MTIYDIAKKAGVSPATVSRVLNDNPNIKKETKLKVQKIINETGYNPNAQARRLSTQNSGLIGIMMPDMENPFFQKILVGITELAYKLKYNIVFYNTAEDITTQYDLLKMVAQERLNGLIMIPLLEVDEKSANVLKWIQNNGVSIVLIDRDIQGVKFDRVFSNDFKGSYDSIKLLINKGHKKIATVAGPLTSKPGKDRYEGYIKALDDNKIKFHDKYVKIGDFMTSKSYELSKELLELSDPPTAIFCANNLTALGTIKAINEKKLKIGEDISLVSFDNLHDLNYIGMNITYVDRPVEYMGSEAIRLLHEKINNKSKQDDEPSITKKIIVDTEVVQKGSENISKNKLS